MMTVTRTLIILCACLALFPTPAFAQAEQVEDLLPRPVRPLEKRTLGGEERQRYRQFERGGSGGAAISPDGKLLMTGLGMQGVLWWDIQTGRALDRSNFLNHGEGLTAAFTPDSKQLVMTGSGGHRQGHPVELWDAVKRQSLRSLDEEVNDTPFSAIAIAPDGKTIALGGAGGQRAGSMNIVFWDLASGDEVAQIEALPNIPQNIPQGRRGQGGILYQALAYSPDGRTLAVLLGDRVLMIEVATRKRRGEMHFTTLPPEHNENGGATAGAMAYSPDGRTLAVGCSDGAIHRFDLREGRELPPMPGHVGAILALCWKPDGKHLLSYGVDGQLFVWNPQRGREWQPKTGPMTDESLEVLWGVLGSDDPLDLFGAGQLLATSPAQTVPFLRKHLSPAAKAESERINRLLQDVETGDYNARKRAVVQLRKIGAAVLPELQKLQKMGRYDQLMNQLAMEFANQGPPPGEARAVRALGVLERIGNPEAVKLLTELSGGAPEAELTVQAKQARQRLAKVEPANTEPTPATLYQTLGGKDPVLAYQAVRALAQRPGNALLLRDRLKELATGDVFNDDPARLAKLIAELDDEDFAVRDNANKALRNLGLLAAPAMRKALAKTENIEPKQRLEHLLSEAGATPSPELVRVMRVLETLELMGGADARQALEAFLKEVKSPWLVQAARESLGRLREEKH